MSEEASSSGVEAALAGYASALEALQDRKPAAGALLAALLQRDRVAAAWLKEAADPGQVQRLAELDEGLHRQAERVADADWLAWREAANPSPRRWWWWLDEAQAKSADEHDFLWVLLAGVLMTVTLGLGVDISSRLWGGGAGALSVVSAALALILTSGPLTGQGRQLAVWLIDKLHLPLRYRGGSMLAAAALFLLITLLIRLVALPLLARSYNNRGVALLQRGELTAAERALTRAASINPEYGAAYYNLAVAYAGIGSFDQATLLYGQALASDRNLDLAYAGLGYALTAQGEAARAIPLLYTGLSLAQDDESRVALWTNLGQALLEAGRPYEAEAALTQALAVNPEEAAAHCTRGLVAEELQRPPDEVRLQWESCLSLADPTTPRGLELAAMARGHLRSLEE